MNRDEEKTTIAEELISYVNLRIDSFKLSLVENLSVLLSGGFGIFIFIIFLSVALMCFIAALTVLLAELIGSVLWALLIVGGVFLIISVIAFVLRDKLIVNSMVRMFSRMFFEKNDDEKNEAIDSTATSSEAE